jgi:hypothetical protein
MQTQHRSSAASATNHPTFTQRRAIRAYLEAQRDAIHHAERQAKRSAPRQPEPANFCAPVAVEREPFDWIDSAVFLCCGVIVAAVILVLSWAGWLS